MLQIRAMLTPKLKRTLEFIKSFTEKNGFAPSVCEIASGTGCVGWSNVHYQINRLVERGYLRRIPNRHRAIEVIDLKARAEGERMAKRLGAG